MAIALTLKGHTFWTPPVPTDSCKFSDYSALYQEYADKIINNTSESSQIVYSLTAQNTVFALTSVNKFTRCGYILTRTEHPKLMIFETTPGDAIFQRTGQINNLDIFTYMNSKFVYVEKHIRTQINQLYRNILLQQCNLELRMMQNAIAALAIAARSSHFRLPLHERARIHGSPGGGSNSHNKVRTRRSKDPTNPRTQECYEQLPVWSNQTYFLTPQTHILMRQGTQITCTFSCTSYVPPRRCLV